MASVRCASVHEQGAENGAIFAAAERAEMDVRPGGIFSIDIATADGKYAPNLGCLLDVVPMERLAWTSMLFPGYRPAVFDDSPITAIVTMEAVPVARCWGAEAIGAKLTAPGILLISRHAGSSPWPCPLPARRPACPGSESLAWLAP